MIYTLILEEEKNEDKQKKQKYRRKRIKKTKIYLFNLIIFPSHLTSKIKNEKFKSDKK